MPPVIRVALEGYNALTDPDVRHYSLVSDEDNVLIKEHSRGTTQINHAAAATITHSLGYSPHCYVYGETSTDGRFQIIVGFNIFGAWRMNTTSTTLVIRNTTGTADREARYFIFYDNIN